MSIKQQIVRFLEDNYGDRFCWGGKVDDYIRQTNGSKSSNVSRRCRELVNAGLLEVVYDQVEGVGPKCARYRIAPQPTYQPIHEELKQAKLIG